MKENLKVIATVKTDFPTKFGIPRQSGLVNTKAKIIFSPKYRDPVSLRGLEDFSHLWLIWKFDKSQNEGWSATVRPPRLGGNKRVGVFATRSPNRPNPIGLSCVKIERIFKEEENGTVIEVSGADLLDGTLIYDIKPYIPYTDCRSDAVGGFSDEVFSQKLELEIPENLLPRLDNEDIENVKAILESDPRPHYHKDPERIYAFEFSKYRIKFKVCNNILTVVSIDLLKNN